MAANLRAKIFTLSIGGVDWTDYCIDAVLQREPLDLESGLIRTTAEFTLDVSELSPLPSWRNDPAQWSRGVQVIFRCYNSANVLITPSMGILYILREPKQASISNPQMKIECGCLLTFKDVDEPDNDYSGVDTGTLTDRDEIIANILTSAGITPSLTAIAYPLDYPIPKNGGSFVQQAGELAAASLNVLYQYSADVMGVPTESTVNKEVDILPGAALFSLTIGQDESEWEPDEASETPPDTVAVSSVSYTVNDKPYTETIEEVEGEDGDGNIIVASRTTVRTYAYDPATVSERTETIIESLKFDISTGPLYPEEYYDLVVSSVSDDINYYDGTGKLIRQTCTTQKTWEELGLIDVYVVGFFTIDGYGESRWELAIEQQSETFYYYNGLQLSRLQTVVKRYRKSVVDGTLFFVTAQNKTDLVTVSEVTSAWTQLSGTRWLYSQSSKIPFILTGSPRLLINWLSDAELFELKKQPGKTYIADDGSADPPATTWLNINELNEVPYEATVTFSPNRDRSKTISIAHATGINQLREFANVYTGILWGRRFGWSVGMPITDALLSSNVLERVDVTDGNTIYRLLIDGLTLAFNSTEAYAAFSGIEIGTATVATPSVVSQLYEMITTARVTATATASGTCRINLDPGNITCFATATASPIINLSQRNQIEVYAEATADASITIENDGQNIIMFAEAIAAPYIRVQ